MKTFTGPLYFVTRVADDDADDAAWSSSEGEDGDEEELS
jgi:hypothetical protein